MERDKQFLMIIIVLIGLSYHLFNAKNIADDKTQRLQDSISDHYRGYKLGYTNAMCVLKYTDSLFETGLIINLTDCNTEQIKRRMKPNPTLTLYNTK